MTAMPRKNPSCFQCRRLLKRWPLAVLLCAGLTGCYGSRGDVETSGNVALLERENVDDPTLLAAALLVDAEKGERAFDHLVERFETQPQAARADVALWLAANALIQDRNRIKAYYYLDQLLDEHPGSSLFYAAVLKQYEIADSYLRNRSDRALVFPVRRHDEAVEMLFRVQQRLPGSPLAEDALKRTADFYFARGDYDFAEDAYGVFIDRFPRSPRIASVRLKQAYSNVLQYDGPRYDPTPLLDAGTQLRQFVAEFPDAAREQQVPQLVNWIEEQLATKLLIASDYYRRTNEQAASRQLQAQLARQYPDTEQAAKARRRMEPAERDRAAGQIDPSAPSTSPTPQAVP